jgi:hypothetical protein
MALYNKEKKYLFIHIYRTGGMAAREYFSGQEVGGGHADAMDLKAYFERNKLDFENTFKFSIVRNPYDWMVSLFHYVSTYKTNWMNKSVNGKSFKDFLVIHNKFIFKHNSDKPMRNKLQSQSAFLSEKGCLMMDFIAKKENFDKDMEYICKKFGLPYKKMDYINSLVKSRDKNYMSYYCPETKKMVQYALEDDFVNFGYKI